MEAVVFGDVEWVLAQELATRCAALFGSVKPYATSTDKDLAGKSITVVRTGGISQDVAVAEPFLSVDVRAESEDEARELAEAASAYALTIGREGLDRDGVTVTDTWPRSLPYENFDPRNPLLHRVTFNMTAVVKGRAL